MSDAKEKAIGVAVQLGCFAVNLGFALGVDKTPGMITINALAAGWCLAYAWRTLWV